MKNYTFLLIGVLLVFGAGLFFFFGTFLGYTGIIIIELLFLAAIIFLLVRYNKEKSKKK